MRSIDVNLSSCMATRDEKINYLKILAPKFHNILAETAYSFPGCPDLKYSHRNCIKYIIA